MQNRSNRGLLFGSRPTAGSDQKSSADAETTESENQLAIDQLRGSAGTIKDIAIHIDSSVDDQNRVLDRMDKRFDSANSLLGNTLNALNDMVNDRNSSRMCLFVAGFFLVLLLLYHFIKKN